MKKLLFSTLALLFLSSGGLLGQSSILEAGEGCQARKKQIEASVTECVCAGCEAKENCSEAGCEGTCSGCNCSKTEKDSDSEEAS